MNFATKFLKWSIFMLCFFALVPIVYAVFCNDQYSIALFKEAVGRSAAVLGSTDFLAVCLIISAVVVMVAVVFYGLALLWQAIVNKWRRFLLNKAKAEYQRTQAVSQQQLALAVLQQHRPGI